MLMPHCFVWGEPYGHSGLIDSLANSVRSFTHAWPEPHFFYRGEQPEVLNRRFVANLYPEPSHFFEAHLRFFEALFAEPARRSCAINWGLKEVRLTADHACYLKWLFPRAKLLFLYRNPFDAYRSYAARRNAGWKWYHTWPHRPLSARLFGSHWNELVSGFLESAERLDGLLVRYEDLHSGGLEAIERYLGCELSREAAAVNPSDGGPRPLVDIPDNQATILQREVGPLAERLGYPLERDSDRSLQQTVASNGELLDPKKCVILTPVGGHIEPECDDALRKLEARGYTVRRVRGYAAIDQARNQMATDALRDGFEELMWIDSDVAFRPEDVERLRSHRLPIVCGIYPKKGKRALSCHVLPGVKNIVFGAGGGLAELLYAATGFLLVRRQVFMDLQQELGLPNCNERFGRSVVPYFMPLLRPELDGHWYLAEDYAFSERSRQCGYRIWADTTIRLRHIGSYAFSWEDAGAQTQRFATYNLQLTPSNTRPRQNNTPAQPTASVADPAPQKPEQLRNLWAAHAWPAERPAVPPNEQHGWLSESTRTLLKASLSERTKLVVELGSWLGLSTRFIAGAAPQAHVIAVDHWQGSAEHQRKPELAGLLPVLYELFLSSCWSFRDRILPVRMTTCEGLEEIARHGLEPDLVYLDADHSYDAVKQGILQIRRLFPGAVLIGDDWNWESVRLAAIDAAKELGEALGVHGTAFRLFSQQAEVAGLPPDK